MTFENPENYEELHEREWYWHDLIAKKIEHLPVLDINLRETYLPTLQLEPLELVEIKRCGYFNSFVKVPDCANPSLRRLITTSDWYQDRRGEQPDRTMNIGQFLFFPAYIYGRIISDASRKGSTLKKQYVLYDRTLLDSTQLFPSETRHVIDILFIAEYTVLKRMQTNDGT